MDLGRFLLRLFPKPPAETVWIGYEHARLTLRRLVNLHLNAWEMRRGKTRLWSRPLKLVIEASNVCNLKCPYCQTGAGDVGRVRSALDLETFKQVLADQARHLFQIEFYNWGEPLLNKSIFAMVEAANREGLATVISTNFSLPFDEERAETLVRSGLTQLYVSVDGLTQDVYEEYRRGGKLDLVMRNVALVAAAKARLGSHSPQIMWGWHTFEHNLYQRDDARAAAPGLGFDSFHDSKGWNFGKPWDGPAEYAAKAMPPFKCFFLWQYSVVHNDGGIAPCCATFYREDDIAKLGRNGLRRASDVWNGPEMAGARAYFDPKRPLGDDENVCRSCPVTLNYREFHDHLAAGGAEETFVSRFPENAIPDYMNERRPAGRDTRRVLREPGEKTRSTHTVISRERRTELGAET